MKLVDFFELAPEFAHEFPKTKDIVTELDESERKAVAYMQDTRSFTKKLALSLDDVYRATFDKPMPVDQIRDASMAVAINDKQDKTLAFLVLDFVWSCDETSRLGAKVVAQGVRPEYKGFGLNKLLFNATEVFLGCFVADKCFDERHELARMFVQLEPDERRMFLVAPCGVSSKKRLHSLAKHGFTKTPSDWRQEEDEVIYERELHLLPPDDVSDASEAF